MFVDPARRLPYPELVEPTPEARNYEIHDSCHVRHAPSVGMVNQVERVMLVPLSEDGGSVIRHEMAHVRWSPKLMPKVPFDHLILLAVEDARINTALRRRGFADAEAPTMRDYALRLARRDLAEKEFGVFMLRCIASLGTEMGRPLFDAAAREAPGIHAIATRIVDMVETRLDASRLRTREREIATVGEAVRVAHKVAEELQRNCIPVMQSGRHRLLIDGGFCSSCQAHAHADDATVRIRRVGGPQDREAAKMNLAEPDLPIPCPARGRNPGGRRSTREGAIVRSANRWFSDKAIFRGRARSVGGTVLVDTSASMKLLAADVDRIMKAAPSATLVAIYSGQHREGELRIVARGGRRADSADLKPYGPGNLIDVPALEWLAKQPGPRVWLSDGRVTGVNDWASRLLGRRCRVICMRHRIKRAETSVDAAAILEGRPVRRLPLVPD